MSGHAMSLAPLIAAVQYNCDIADARHAREMTLCSYLLQMREFYRWQLDLPLGQMPDRQKVAKWIRAREARWETLIDADFSPIELDGVPFDPYAVTEINAVLQTRHLVYGGRLGRFCKPHFFLAELAHQEKRGPLTVLVCGRELARDIAALPALLQGQTIVVRRAALRQWLGKC